MSPVTTWAMVFCSVALADFAWAKYMKHAADDRAFAAAAWSGVIMLLGAASTVLFVDDHSVITAAIAGAMVGTYVSIKTGTK